MIRLNPRAWARFAIWRPMFPRPIRPSWGLVTGTVDHEENEGYESMGKDTYCTFPPVFRYRIPVPPVSLSA